MTIPERFDDDCVAVPYRERPPKEAPENLRSDVFPLTSSQRR